MIRPAIVSLLCLFFFLSDGQIMHSVIVTPANITSSDTITIHTRKGILASCSLAYKSCVITNDTIYISCCYFIRATIGTVSCIDTQHFTIPPQLNGMYYIKYVVNATEDTSDVICTEPYLTDSTLTSFAVGVNEIYDFSFKDAIYPNPVYDKLYLPAKLGLDKTGFQILSIDGRILMQSSVSQQPNFEIDVSTLAAGAYLLQIQDDKHRWVTRFVKN